MAVREKKPILFGLRGDPLCDAGGAEQEAESKEEALEKAVKCKRTKYLKALEREAEFVILPDVEKAQKALFEAKTAEEAEECLRAGASVNTRDEYGWMPLHEASWHGHDRVVEMLLVHGAGINARNNNGSTPLHLASCNGRADMVEQLLMHGATVDAVTDNINTPLHLASSGSHADVVEVLLANGADANTSSNHRDWTPLHYASDRGSERVVEQLLAGGADMNARDAVGRTSLYWAVKRGHSHVANQLREHGATE